MATPVWENALQRAPEVSPENPPTTKTKVRALVDTMATVLKKTGPKHWEEHMKCIEDLRAVALGVLQTKNYSHREFFLSRVQSLLPHLGEALNESAVRSTKVLHGAACIRDIFRCAAAGSASEGVLREDGRMMDHLMALAGRKDKGPIWMPAAAAILSIINNSQNARGHLAVARKLISHLSGKSPVVENPHSREVWLHCLMRAVQLWDWRETKWEARGLKDVVACGVVDKGLEVRRLAEELCLSIYVKFPTLATAVTDACGAAVKKRIKNAIAALDDKNGKNELVGSTRKRRPSLLNHALRTPKSSSKSRKRSRSIYTSEKKAQRTNSSRKLRRTCSVDSGVSDIVGKKSTSKKKSMSKRKKAKSLPIRTKAKTPYQKQIDARAISEDVEDDEEIETVPPLRLSFGSSFAAAVIKKKDEKHDHISEIPLEHHQNSKRSNVEEESVNVSLQSLPCAILNELKEMRITLADTKTIDWEVRRSALIRLQVIANSSDAQLPEFAAECSALAPMLVAQVCDLRSAVMKEACVATSSVASALGSRFRIGHKFVVPLLKMCCWKKHVMANAARSCLSELISAVPTGFPKMVDTFVKEFVSGGGGKERKRFLLSYMCDSLKLWPVEAFSAVQVAVVDMIKSSLVSGDQETREYARLCIIALERPKMMPREAQKILSRLSKKQMQEMDATRDRLLKSTKKLVSIQTDILDGKLGKSEKMDISSEQSDDEEFSSDAETPVGSPVMTAREISVSNDIAKAAAEAARGDFSAMDLDAAMNMAMSEDDSMGVLLTDGMKDISGELLVDSVPSVSSKTHSEKKKRKFIETEEGVADFCEPAPRSKRPRITSNSHTIDTDTVENVSDLKHSHTIETDTVENVSDLKQRCNDLEVENKNLKAEVKDLEAEGVCSFLAWQKQRKWCLLLEKQLDMVQEEMSRVKAENDLLIETQTNVSLTKSSQRRQSHTSKKNRSVQISRTKATSAQSTGGNLRRSRSMVSDIQSTPNGSVSKNLRSTGKKTRSALGKAGRMVSRLFGSVLTNSPRKVKNIQVTSTENMSSENA